MLAPAFESVLDGADPDRAALLMHGRDLWPAIAHACGIELIRDGAGWSAHDDRSAGMGRELSARLSALGFDVSGPAEAPFSRDDWRLAPDLSLQRLLADADRRSGRVQRAGADRDQAWVELDDGARLSADHVVLAHGVGDLVCRPAHPVLGLVQPIKGQILAARAEAPAHVVRTLGAYVVPQSDGVLVGASMEAGRRDRVPDPAVSAQLLAVASQAWSPLGRATGTRTMAAVRGATPDGLPCAGPVAPRISVALAPRRNGWLLAPLVGEIVAAYCCGTDPGPYAAALDPLRFASSV